MYLSIHYSQYEYKTTFKRKIHSSFASYTEIPSIVYTFLKIQFTMCQKKRDKNWYGRQQY